MRHLPCPPSPPPAPPSPPTRHVLDDTGPWLAFELVGRFVLFVLAVAAFASMAVP